MSQESFWGVFLVLCLCSSTFSMNCKWLQPGQERLSKRILLIFERMGEGERFPVQCTNSSTFPPNIDFISNTIQVELAVLTLNEVTHQINKFYSKGPHSVGCNSKTLETFQTHLDHQSKDLSECIAMNTLNPDLQWEMKKAIRQYFSKMEEIASDKLQDNNLCPRNIVRIEVQKHLQLSAQLMTRFRRLHLLRTSSA